jgi:hypothetical protein
MFSWEKKKNSDAGLRASQTGRAADTNSSADDDTETGVVVCWACGEVRVCSLNYFFLMSAGEQGCV